MLLVQTAGMHCLCISKIVFTDLSKCQIKLLDLNKYFKDSACLIYTLYLYYCIPNCREPHQLVAYLASIWQPVFHMFFYRYSLYVYIMFSCWKQINELKCNGDDDNNIDAAPRIIPGHVISSVNSRAVGNVVQTPNSNNININLNKLQQTERPSVHLYIAQVTKWQNHFTTCLVSLVSLYTQDWSFALKIVPTSVYSPADVCSLDLFHHSH